MGQTKERKTEGNRNVVRNDKGHKRETEEQQKEVRDDRKGKEKVWRQMFKFWGLEKNDKEKNSH